MEKKNLIDLFKAGGESTALAFEMNRHSKLISRYEIEKLTKKLVKDKKIHSSLLYSIAKKYKLFPMYRRMYFRDRCKGYFYETTHERVDKINAVLQAEISRELHITVIVARFMNHGEIMLKDDDYNNWTGIILPIYLMHVRITKHQEENEYYQHFTGVGPIEPIIEDYGFEFDYSAYQINQTHREYIALRKKYGYTNEPISPLFL